MTEGQALSARTSDGVYVAMRRFKPEAETKAVLVCTHAMMANSRYFTTFAQYLAFRGIDTFTVDWRGHGRSVPPSPKDRDQAWCFDDYVERDLPAVMRAVSRQTGVPHAKLCYLGHSLGGLVGLAAFGTEAVPLPRRLSLWATSVWLPGKLGNPKRRLIMEVYRQSSRLLGYAPIRALSMGTDNEPRSYVEQLTDWARTGCWTSRRGRDYLDTIANIDTPTWSVIGRGDWMCTMRDARALHDRLPKGLSIREVGRRHGDAVNAKHFDLFKNETLRPVWDELVDFLT